jgi:tRNA A-37 threonylcarbamoyl transferase component Bud32
MESPFKIFRKYQKQMMAAMVVLAMFAFVLGDALSRLFGNRAPRSEVATDAVVTIGADNEKLTRAEINRMIGRRRVANEFIGKAVIAARPLDTYDYFKLNERLAQMQQQRDIAQRQFRFTGQSEEKDVVVGHLLRKEAERMGVIISDDQVNKYIENSTQNKLTKEQFRTIVNQLQSLGTGGVDAPMLYSILREELMAKVAQGQEVPNLTESPENYWDFYRRLHESQQIEVVPLATAQFTDGIPDPSSEELQAFFEKRKKEFDHFDEEGVFQLGFRQPDKVRLQYLREKFADVQARVDKANPVTDKDIVAYYEANKDMQYIDRPVIEGDTGPFKPGIHLPLDPLLTPKSDGKKPEGPALPGSTTTNGKAAPSVPSAEKPTEKPAATDAKKADAEKKKEETAKTPVVTPPAAAKAGEAAPKAPAKEAPKAADPAKDGKKQSRMTRRARIVLAAYADENDAKKDSKSAAAPKADVKPADAKPAEKKDAAKAPEKAAEPPKNAATPPAKSEPKAEPKTTPPVDAKTPAKPDDKAGEPKVTPGPTKKYRPLNDELKKEIREHLRKERAFQEMRTQADLAQAGFRKVSSSLNKKFNLLRLKPADVPKIVAASETELKELATKMQMEYGSTPLYNQRDLQNLTGLGTAREPSANFMEQTPTLVQRVFSTEETLVPGLAEDQTTSDMYVYWKAEYVAEKVGDLSDPEVKAQVVKAWKLLKAEPLARKRAEELAGILAKQGTKSATDVLAKTTVTGEAKSPQLTVLDIPPFTWLSTPSAASGMFPQRGRTVQMSEVPRIEKPGEEFMSTIYDLKTGAWGVAHAYDKSTFYVVKVVGRKETKKEDFLKAPLFARGEDMMFMGPTPYDSLAQIDTTRLFQRYLNRLNDKYKVKWADKKDGDQSNAPTEYSEQDAE